jgi:hypothetical protein
VPAEGTANDRDDFYQVIRDNSVRLDIDDEMFGGTALIYDQFLDKDANYLVEGLWGCLGIIVLSHRGKRYDERVVLNLLCNGVPLEFYSTPYQHWQHC